MVFLGLLPQNPLSSTKRDQTLLCLDAGGLIVTLLKFLPGSFLQHLKYHSSQSAVNFLQPYASGSLADVSKCGAVWCSGLRQEGSGFEHASWPCHFHACVGFLWQRQLCRKRKMCDGEMPICVPVIGWQLLTLPLAQCKERLVALPWPCLAVNLPIHLVSFLPMLITMLRTTISNSTMMTFPLLKRLETPVIPIQDCRLLQLSILLIATSKGVPIIWSRPSLWDRCWIKQNSCSFDSLSVLSYGKPKACRYAQHRTFSFQHFKGKMEHCFSEVWGYQHLTPTMSVKIAKRWQPGGQSV